MSQWFLLKSEIFLWLIQCIWISTMDAHVLCYWIRHSAIIGFVNVNRCSWRPFSQIHWIRKPVTKTIQCHEKLGQPVMRDDCHDDRERRQNRCWCEWLMKFWRFWWRNAGVDDSVVEWLYRTKIAEQLLTMGIVNGAERRNLHNVPGCNI